MTEEFYRLGQQMVTYFADTSALGVLSLPVALTGGECTDGNPAGFFQTASSSCSRHLADLRSACTSLPALNAGTYYQGFTLLQVRIEPQNIQSVPTPTLTKIFCNNVVSGVTYRILIDGNVGIIEANVTFSFVNVSLETSKIWQDFNIIFVTDPEQREARKRSGNPGYLSGSPVLAFRGQEPMALSLVRGDVDGRCETINRNRVDFTLNSRTGCSHSLDPAATCRERQESINLLLLGDRIPDSLGILGNVSGTDASSLTRILNAPPSATDVKCETICNLALKMNVQILWAHLGSVSNPQSAILGARFQYQTEEVQCDQTEIALQSSATFLDASLPPLPPRETPSPQEKLPFDIFLPFRGLDMTRGALGEAGREMGSIGIIIIGIVISRL
ncbi:tectonic-3-like isoform X3 [Rhinoraja longicauda]